MNKVAKISPEFVKEYVEKQGNIKEVKLEYDEKFITDEWFTLDNLDEAEFISQKKLQNEHGTQFSVSDLTEAEVRIAPKIISLKLDSQGCVIISPIEEKVYTRQDMFNLAKDIFTSFNTEEFNEIKMREEHGIMKGRAFGIWFNKNYPK